MAGKWQPEGQLLENLGKMEHLRWNAFHFCMGYSTMTREEYDRRAARYKEDIAQGRRPIRIGKNVWIGAGSMILKGACIEDGCIIAAGSVVKGRVEKGNVFVQKRQATLIPITSGDNENEN